MDVRYTPDVELSDAATSTTGSADATPGTAATAATARLTGTGPALLPVAPVTKYTSASWRWTSTNCRCRSTFVVSSIPQEARISVAARTMPRTVDKDLSLIHI